MTRVLIVNDSVTEVSLIKRIIATDNRMEVAGVAGDGQEAVQMVEFKKPDVVLMDIHMPKMDGVEATRRIMSSFPCPILIVTFSIKASMSPVYDCLRYGAFEVIKTPVLCKDTDPLKLNDAVLNRAGSQLLRRIEIVAQLKAVALGRSENVQNRTTVKPPMTSLPAAVKSPAKKIVVIGASTGGPSATLKVLQGLPKDIKAGVVVIQHMDGEFTKGYAEWLSANNPITTHEAINGEPLFSATGYLAAGSMHMIISAGKVVQYQDVPGLIYRPSVDLMFESAAKVFGHDAVGVLLSGMGDDGAKGLKAMRQAGAGTIAQDEATSAIYGMPKVAAEIGAAEFILPVDKIAGKVLSLIL